MRWSFPCPSYAHLVGWCCDNEGMVSCYDVFPVPPFSEKEVCERRATYTDSTYLLKHIDPLEDV